MLQLFSIEYTRLLYAANARHFLVVVHTIGYFHFITRYVMESYHSDTNRMLKASLCFLSTSGNGRGIGEGIFRYVTNCTIFLSREQKTANFKIGKI